MGVAGRGFALWAQNATKLWTVLVPAFGAVQLLGVLMIDSAVPSGSFVINNTIVVNGASTAGIVRTEVVVIILIVLVSVFATGVALRIFASAAAGESESASAATHFGIARYGSLFWVSVLYGICIAAGSVLLVAPGIYVLVAFAVALPVLAIEDVRGGKALSRSRELVSGRWWATLAAFLPSIGLCVGGYLIIGAAIHVNGTVANLTLTRGVAQLVLEVLLTPILTATTVAIYADLRARKEPGALLDLSEPVAAAAVASSPAPAAQGESWWG
ncbi:MAG TPA: hypothetical protein VKS25_12475 [Solirubrobacteraceae bacterium]|nr:hypothetical protein [Solirubrobacteraceae bacterium]